MATKGRRAYTRELYQKLVQGFRECPGNGAGAARWAGCDPRTARKCYEFGWSQYPWARPIREVLAEEADDLRKRQAALIQQEAEHEAKLQAERQSHDAEAQEQELQLLKLARHDVLTALAAAAKLGPAMQVLADVVVKAVQSGIDSPDKALRILGEHSKLMQRASDAGERVLKLSRLVRGATTENVGIQEVEEDLSYEDALQELQAADDIRAMLEEKRAKEVIDVEAETSIH